MAARRTADESLQVAAGAPKVSQMTVRPGDNCTTRTNDRSLPLPVG